MLNIIKNIQNLLTKMFHKNFQNSSNDEFVRNKETQHYALNKEEMAKKWVSKLRGRI